MSLIQSLKEFEKRYNDVIKVEDLKDSGTQLYAFRIRNRRKSTEAVFCYKNSMKGNLVSIHRDALEHAKAKEIPVIMDVKGRYYMYTVADIERNCKENTWHGQRMVNFPITAGISLQEQRTKKAEPQHDSLFEDPKMKLVNEHLGPLERVG